MTAVAARGSALSRDEARLADTFVRWLETGIRPGDLFADDVFTDLTVPHWRLQAEGADASFRLREDNHPFPGTVTVNSLDRTARGFVIALEERWDNAGQRWYCREMMHCAVTDGRISELDVYCTGDWDESVQRQHAEHVHLARA